MSTLHDKALRACAEYEFWAAEVTRLTGEIGATVCPSESDPEFETHSRGESSCFAAASEEEVDVRVEVWMGEIEEHGRRRNLREIAEAVKDCPECSRLCDLIAARKHARKQFGVAKRRVRQIGKQTA